MTSPPRSRPSAPPPVASYQWERFLDIQVPRLDPGTGLPLTAAQDHRRHQTRRPAAALPPRPAGRALGRRAHGVLQAVNTYDHHEAAIRGTDRPERNMLKTVTGAFAALDRQAWTDLSQVLVPA